MLPVVGICQVVAIQNDRENTVFLCFPNPLTVAAENYEAKFIRLETDNGTIAKGEGPGRFEFTPKRVGSAVVKVYGKRGGKTKLLGSMELRVKRIPGKMMFAGSAGGPLSKQEINKGIGLSCIITGQPGCGTWGLSSYRVVVLRNGAEVFNRNLHDSTYVRIDDETLSFFDQLKNNDRLVFKDIFAKDCDGVRTFDSLEFTVTDEDKYQYHEPPEVYTDPITGEERHRKPVEKK
jgi:hypothetical protein